MVLVIPAGTIPGKLVVQTLRDHWTDCFL